MSKKFVYIIALIMIVTFTLTTVGVNLHHHFCGKTGKQTVNILSTPECFCESELVDIKIHEEEDESSCCEQHSQNEHKSKNDISIGTDNCCTDSSELAALEDDFISNQDIKFRFDFMITQPIIAIITESETFQNIDCYIKSQHQKFSLFANKLILKLLIHFSSSKDSDEDSL